MNIVIFQSFVQKKMKSIANGGTKMIAQGSQMSQRNTLTYVTNAGQAITRVSDAEWSDMEWFLYDITTTELKQFKCSIYVI